MITFNNKFEVDENVWFRESPEKPRVKAFIYGIDYSKTRYCGVEGYKTLNPVISDAVKEYLTYRVAAFGYLDNYENVKEEQLEKYVKEENK